MLKFLIRTRLRILLIGAILAVVTSPVRADHTGAPCVSFKEGAAIMKKEYGEVPIMVLNLPLLNSSLFFFASPTEPYTWTGFVLNEMDCLVELKGVSGDGWPKAVAFPVPGRDAGAVR